MRLAKIEGILLMIFALLLNPVVASYVYELFTPLQDQVVFILIVLFQEAALFVFGLYIYINPVFLENLLKSAIHFLMRKEVILLLFSIILSIAFAEVTLRYLDPYLHEHSPDINDPYLHWVNNPRMNPASEGYTEIAIDLDNIDATDLVYAIGDSHNFGVVGYKDNFITLIDDNLTYDVVNLGVPAYGVNLYYRAIKKYVDIKKPSMIFLSFYVGNDYTDDASHVVVINSRFKRFDSVLVAIALRHSYLLKDIYELFDEPPANILERRGPLPDNTTYYRNEYLYIMYAGMEIAKKSQSADVDSSTKGSLDIMRNIVDYCKAKDIPLIVFILPAEYQVSPKLRQEIYSVYGVNADMYDLAKPQAMIKQFLETKGVPYIDLLPEFQQQNKSLYKLRDSHFNEEGNRLAADIINKQLNDWQII